MNYKDVFRNKYFQIGVKTFFTFLCFYILYTKLDFARISGIIESANLFYITLAILFFILSKYFSAVRLKIFFNSIPMSVSALLNLKLYLLGMYYNLFLPGSVGGDAYKAYYLRERNKNVLLKDILLSIIFDRLNGLVVLFILMLILFYFIKIYFEYKTTLIVGSSIFLFFLLFLLMRIFFRRTEKKYLDVEQGKSRNDSKRS